MRRAFGVLIGIAFVLGACSSGDGDGDAGPPTSGADSAPAIDTAHSTSTSTGGSTTTSLDPGTGGPTTTTVPDLDAAVAQLDAFGELLDDDGTLSFEAALALFAANIRPLPGVDPAAEVVDEDSILLRRISLDLDRLTPEQRAVVGDVLGGPATPLDQIADGGGGGASAGFPRRGTVAQAAPVIREAMALLERELGFGVPESFFVLVDLPMVEPDGTRNFSNPLNAASATPEYAGDELRQCRIRLNNDALDETHMFRSQIAHEVFHCVQYWSHGGANWPLWAGEGGAGWVGEAFAGGSGMSGTWWARWIDRPRMSLVTRSYDAIGLFALVDRLGANAFQVALDAAGTGSLATVTAATGDELLDLWGTHYGDPAWGPEWSVVGPGAPATRAPTEAFAPVLDGGPSFVTDSRNDPGTSATAIEFAAPGDVLRMTGFAGLHGGVRFGDGTVVAVTASGDFCLTPGGCVCPAGSTGGGPTRPVGSNQVFVGLGPGSSSGPQFEALSLERFCTSPVPDSVPAAPEDGRDGCLVGRWVSTRAIMPTDASINETVSGGAGLVEVFGADGTLTVDASAVSAIVAVVDAPEDQRFKTTVTYTGAGSGTWSTSGGRLAVAGVDLGGFRIDYVSEIIGIGIVVQDGFPMNDPRFGALGAGGIGSGDYTCNGSTLLITNDIPGVGLSGFEFTRG